MARHVDTPTSSVLDGLLHVGDGTQIELRLNDGGESSTQSPGPET
jgi:hypothetical protein